MITKLSHSFFSPGELSLVVSVALMAVVIAVSGTLNNSAHTSTVPPATPSETFAATGTKIMTGCRRVTNHPCLESITN